MESLQKELYFKVADSDFELHSCYRLRYKVYCEEKRWISPDNFPDKMEKDEYDAKAVHVIAMNEDFEIVGLMRIINNKDYQRLPYLDHPGMKGKSLQAKNIAELSRFVVTANSSRYYVLKGLIRGVYQVSRRMGIDNWVFVCEPSLPRLLSMFRFQTDTVCLPTKFYGGLTQVGIIDIPKVERNWRRSDLQALRFNTSDMVMMSPSNEMAV